MLSQKFSDTLRATGETNETNENETMKQITFPDVSKHNP